jgi:hypothetical protein
MEALHRRLLRLEDRFGRSVETEHMRELRRRIEAGRRRVAAPNGKSYLPWRPSGTPAGLTLAEAIIRGRQRAREDLRIGTDIGS